MTGRNYGPLTYGSFQSILTGSTAMDGFDGEHLTGHFYFNVNFEPVKKFRKRSVVGKKRSGKSTEKRSTAGSR